MSRKLSRQDGWDRHDRQDASQVLAQKSCTSQSGLMGGKMNYKQDWVECKDQNPDGGIRLIQLADIGDGFFKNKSNRHLTKEKAKELNCTFLNYNDILIARMPDPLGRVCLFPYKENEKYVTVVDVSILRISDLLSEKRFFNFFLNAPQIRQEISNLQSGSTRKRISKKNLQKILIPLPPLPEQRTIVSKIETLFTELDVNHSGC